MRNLSARHFIIAAILLVAIIFGAWHFVLSTKQDITLQEHSFLSELSMQHAVTIQNTVQMELDKLTAIANYVGSSEELDIEEILTLLTSECERSSYKRMGFAPEDGIAITTDGQNVDLNDRYYYLRARNGSPSVSDRLVDKVDGCYINVYAVPVYHKKSVAGVIIATNETTRFTQLLATEAFDGEGFSYVVTDEGMPVIYTSHKNSASEFDNLFDEMKKSGMSGEEVDLIRRNMSENVSGVYEYGLQGVERIGAYHKVGINDWYVVSVVPKDVVSQKASYIILRNAKVSLVMIAVVFLFFLYIAILSRKNKRSLLKIAFYDELTGVSNLNGFKKEAKRLITEHPKQQYVIGKLDIQGFKGINGLLGEKIGDLMIQLMAETVFKVKTEKDLNHRILGRVHADEFLILDTCEGNEEEIVTNILSFEQRFNTVAAAILDNHKVHFRYGGYFLEQGETDIQNAIEKANLAHGLARKKKDSKICFYDDDMRHKLYLETELESKMEDALAKGDFKVFLQAKYELKGDSIAGAEALVRWRQPDGSLISPNVFIPLFEQNGFITKLDFYMFEQVCRIIQDWIDRGRPVVTVSVNFSKLHVSNPNFVSRVVEIANQYRIPKKYLELEFTETVIFNNEDTLVKIITKLHEEGFSVSMDDFGTGYSSLGLLKNLSVDVIKMDRSFFLDSSDNARAKSVIECVMQMAKRLNIHTVAEGIETKERVEFLREVGCDMVQGFYFAKPIPSEEFVIPEIPITKESCCDENNIGNDSS